MNYETVCIWHYSILRGIITQGKKMYTENDFKTKASGETFATHTQSHEWKC